jgi:hypothetical protein
MPFSSDRPELPVSLRLCRSLLLAQAVYTLFGGAFVLLTAVLLGGNYALPFHDGTLSGSGAAMLGAVYVISAAALSGLGVALGRTSPWARPAIVGMQVFLTAVQLFRALDLSVSTVVNIALLAAIVILLFVPQTQRALDRPARA